ncbi:MAG: NTP transferase domain-containing protein [Planctomycetes bacterium]|nr:NTP transferase domain-containing protein [Planctomycetota bacterium]
MSSDDLALVVLAAGASARLGEPKALVRLVPGPSGTALEILLAAGAALGDPLPLVVGGAAHAQLSGVVPSGVELVHNRAWSTGRTSSVRCGMELRPGRDLCLAPVDVPLVPAGVFAALGAEWRRQGRPERGWLAPFVERAGVRRFGHPVLVGRGLLLELKAFPPERPLHALRAQASPLLALAVDSEAVLDDLDTPFDLERLRARSR